MTFTPDNDVVAEYRALSNGEFATGARGSLLFVVSTDDLSQSKGDLYVGLGLAKYLHRLGWGITLWPTSRWSDETPAGMDVALVMIESFVPGFVRPETKLVAWVRNWTDSWAELPYLDAFTQIWCSSVGSAGRMREVFSGPVEVLPLAADAELFVEVPTGRRSELVTTANFWGVTRKLIAALVDLADSEQVTWFGKNARFLQIPPTIDHRHTIDYFALPWVYSSWQFVVDDLIPEAAKYGNHNSRLFDAIACGGLIITNTSTGLADLGLEGVPVYGDGKTLAEVVVSLRESPDTEALTRELQSHVRSNHTYAHRADAASPWLEAAVASTAKTPSRTELLRFTATIREQMRSLRAEYDELRVHEAELGRDLARMQAERDARWYARVGRILHLAASPTELAARLRATRAPRR
jgi:hypothetical protein